jgi:hypothetical protein
VTSEAIAIGINSGCWSFLGTPICRSRSLKGRINRQSLNFRLTQQLAGRMSQRVRALRGPMTGSA